MAAFFTIDGTTIISPTRLFGKYTSITSMIRYNNVEVKMNFLWKKLVFLWEYFNYEAFFDSSISRHDIKSTRNKTIRMKRPHPIPAIFKASCWIWVGGSIAFFLRKMLSTEPPAATTNMQESQYLSLIKTILASGSTKSDRTHTGTTSLFAPQPLKFSLLNNTFPLLTTKRVPARHVFEELMWFIRYSF